MRPIAVVLRGSVTHDTSSLPRPAIRSLAVPRPDRGKPSARHRAPFRPRAAVPEVPQQPDLRAWVGALVHDRLSLAGLVLLAVAMVGSVALAFGREALLPAKFSFDARFIQRLATSGRLDAVDRSFSNTASLYRMFGLQSSPTVVALISTVALIAVVVAALAMQRARRLQLDAVLVGAIALVLGAVYLATYSKDAPVLVVAAAVVLLRGSRRAELAIVLVAAAYGYVFRPYWYLVIAFYLVLRITHRFWPRWWVWLAAAGASIVLFGLVVAIAMHSPPDYFREAVNIGRMRDADAQSMIRPLLTAPEPLAGLVNVMTTFGALFVPVPLLLMASPYYIGVFLLVAALWGAFWVAVFRAERRGATTTAWRRAVAFLVAFVAVQAFFEPDFGSSLRHLTPLLPVLAFVVAGASGRVSVAPRRSRRLDPVTSVVE